MEPARETLNKAVREAVVEEVQEELAQERMRDAKPPNVLNELLTRRDAFAAAALTGMLAHGTDERVHQKAYALEAYEWADFMLEAREG